ncbi:MAG: helix-turn-helix domain-containing protein [Muribaculaceae bacterium]|nr:helix-turn-helix domain-containing protein [Muribaculaceae bacterium]
MLERLRDILKERRLTLKAFSEMSGISQPNLSNYINGNISPTLETIDKIAKSLNLDIQDLFPKSKEDIELFANFKGKSYRITTQDILEIIRNKETDGYK